MYNDILIKNKELTTIIDQQQKTIADQQQQIDDAVKVIHSF